MTPFGVFVSGRDKNHKNAKYGNKLAANRDEAKSAEPSVSPLTDQAFVIAEISSDELSAEIREGSVIICKLLMLVAAEKACLLEVTLSIWLIVFTELKHDNVDNMLPLLDSTATK